LWQVTLLDAAHGAAAGAQLYGSLGITSTPVIDLSSNTLYVVGASFEDGQVIYRLHALALATGAEEFGGPVTITASVAGTAFDGSGGVVTLSPASQNQRAGLLLLNGIVYVSFTAYTEAEEDHWHGWIIGYRAGTLVQTGVFCTTPNGAGGGIWMSGDGLAADQLEPGTHPYGRMFIATGNGDFTATSPYANDMDFGDSIVNLDLTNGVPTASDDFTPNIQAVLAAEDDDQGSGGVLILPTQTAGAYPDLLVQAGKSGAVYLVNRDSLGGYNTTTNNVVQSLPNAVGGSGPQAKEGVWSSPAYWSGNVYYWGVYDNLKSFALQNGLLSTTPTTSSEESAYPGPTPAISANGNSNGIVWTINENPTGPAILEAHNASNVATTLYTSDIDETRDRAGAYAQFSVPTIANGEVFVGTASQLDVYGLLNSSQTSTPAISPGSESFVDSIRVTIKDATAKAKIYYTLDGTPATINSNRYAGPIEVTSNQVVNAIAVAPGFAASNQAWASYTLKATAAPTFSPAAMAYSTSQSVAISDTTAGAVIHYTTDGSTPTVSSSTYTAPIAVSGSQTVNAIAVAPGYSNSNVASAAYEISAASLFQIDDPTGFASAANLTLLGQAAIKNDALQLSLAGKGSQKSAVWYTTRVNVQTFTTDFDFTEAVAAADGFTFTLQNASPKLKSLGGGSMGLGYQGIGSSVAVKFDLFDDLGEGIDSTGFYTNGAAPILTAADMTGSGVNLHSTDTMHAHITYDGTTLTLTVSDLVTGASFTTSTAIDIPEIVGGSTAYAGFTASTSRAGATQTILTWTYLSGG
jgi:hypothetical protein